MVIPIRDENPTRRSAVVTVALIVVNLAVYFGIQYPKSDAAEARFASRYPTPRIWQCRGRQMWWRWTMR